MLLTALLPSTIKSDRPGMNYLPRLTLPPPPPLTALKGILANGITRIVLAAGAAVAIYTTFSISRAPRKKVRQKISRPPVLTIDEPLRLHVHEHCQFCTRVRFILGLKNIQYELHFVSYEDTDALALKIAGKKVSLPILEFPRTGVWMTESMDMVLRINEGERFGARALSANRGPRAWSKVEEWRAINDKTLKWLLVPRLVNAHLLPEFTFQRSRDLWLKRHPLPGWDKDKWMDDSKISAMQRYAKVKELMEDKKKQRQLLTELNRAVQELDSILASPYHAAASGLSYDDVQVFAVLRPLTIIKGLQLPAKAQDYLEYLAAKTDIPLYTSIAA